MMNGKDRHTRGYEWGEKTRTLKGHLVLCVDEKNYPRQRQLRQLFPLWSIKKGNVRNNHSLKPPEAFFLLPSSANTIRATYIHTYILTL